MSEPLFFYFLLFSKFVNIFISLFKELFIFPQLSKYAFEFGEKKREKLPKKVIGLINFEHETKVD